MTSVPVTNAAGEPDEDDGLAEDGSRTATLRLIPDDPNSRNLIVFLNFLV